MRVGVLRFPGTNCDRDVFEALNVCSLKPEWLWYNDQFQYNDYEAFFLPGGFSFGDYLRCGALAARAPALKSLREAAQKGRPIMGICNGFQILCEAQLLPGVLVRNNHLRFIDQWVSLELVNAGQYFKFNPQSIDLPIAHGEGCYFVESDQLQSLYENGQVWLKYKIPVNGSLDQIAGVMNDKKNVYGLMPHPERALYSWQGGENGRLFFESLLNI